jgi:PIN domain nuclease of toxin-antitoxin system
MMRIVPNRAIGGPLDRLLIAQSRIEGLTIVTTDKLLRRYDVNCLW